jgi:putative peptide zinc metalloprotease protein
MTPASPKLRSDLTVARQDSAGGPVCVVKDPASGKFFRWGELEAFIAQQLDGATPLDAVRERTERQFGASLSVEALTAFVGSLDQSHLLETAEGRSRKSRLGRVRGSLLYLRWPLLDPDQLFNRMVRWVQSLFTPSFVAVSVALVLLGVGVTAANWGDITGDFSRLYHVSAIPLIVAVMFVVGSAHEFAHGLTCKHFGGQVHEMGLMLIYFQPAMYTNVSDAWLFPRRRERLWVGFAGPWFELFLWALATLTWRLTDPETWLNYVSLVVMTVSGIKTLFNFNPLIKLDGYYLLSDYLDIPNLRQKAFAYVGDLIKRVFGFGAGPDAGIPPRERRAFLLYGITATLCSTVLLVYAFVTVGGFLVEAQQPAALAVLTALVGIRSRGRFRRLFGAATDEAEPEEAPSGNGADAAAPRKERKKKKKDGAGIPKRRLMWAGLAAGILALVVFGRMELRMGGAFTVLPTENADVRAEVEGIIDSIAVDEGDSVAAGDLIAQLSNHALQAELGKTEAAAREMRAGLQKLEAGPLTDEVDIIRAQVSRVEDRLGFARTRAERLQSLYEANVVTRQELEVAQELAATAENDLAEVKGRLGVLLRRTRPEDLEAMRARLSQLETQRAFLAQEVEELTVRSPVAGVVATPSRQLKEMARQFVGRGALIAKVYDFGTVMAQILVSEKDIGDVQVGQPVVLRVRAYPNVAFQGTVTAIATAAAGTPVPGAAVPGTAAAGVPARPTFLVTTEIDNRAGLLKAGMTGHAKVLGGSRSIIGLLTRKLARLFRVEVWSWW